MKYLKLSLIIISICIVFCSCVSVPLEIEDDVIQYEINPKNKSNIYNSNNTDFIGFKADANVLSTMSSNDTFLSDYELWKQIQKSSSIEEMENEIEQWGLSNNIANNYFGNYSFYDFDYFKTDKRYLSFIEVKENHCEENNNKISKTIKSAISSLLIMGGTPSICVGVLMPSSVRVGKTTVDYSTTKGIWIGTGAAFEAAGLLLAITNIKPVRTSIQYTGNFTIYVYDREDKRIVARKDVNVNLSGDYKGVVGEDDDSKNVLINYLSKNIANSILRRFENIDLSNEKNDKEYENQIDIKTINTPDEQQKTIENDTHASKMKVICDKTLKADFEVENNSIITNIKNKGTDESLIRVYLDTVKLKKNKRYLISFNCYSDIDKKIVINVNEGRDQYQRFMRDTLVEISKENKRYEYSFFSTRDYENALFEFCLGKTSGLIVLSDITFEEEGGEISYDEEEVNQDEFGLVRFKDWKTSFNWGGAGTYSKNQQSSEIKIEITSNTPDWAFDVNVSQDSISLKKNKKYQIIFDGYAEEDGIIKVQAYSKKNNRSILIPKQIKITKNKGTYVAEFTSNADYDDIVVEFGVGLKRNVIYLSKIKLIEK